MFSSVRVESPFARLYMVKLSNRFGFWILSKYAFGPEVNSYWDVSVLFDAVEFLIYQYVLIYLYVIVARMPPIDTDGHTTDYPV